MLCYDDFETCNPLGAKAGIHKLGAVYATVPCLPPHVLSRLENIFLVSLFHASDRSVFDNKRFFSDLIDELNSLDTEVITLGFNSIRKTIHFKVAVIVGDNLGVHGIFGFTESFSANYSCRFCKADKNNCENSLVQNDSLMRTKENYEQDLTIDNVSLTGVKDVVYRTKHFI